MTTVLNPNGLLAYGDNDGTVIWRSPLTSESSISTPEIGGQQTFNKVGTGQLFDPVKGMLPGSAGYYWLNNLNNNANLNYSGQVTLQVPTAMLACAAANSDGSSGGQPQTGNETLIGMSDSTSTNANYVWNLTVVDKVLYLVVGWGTNTSSVSYYISDVIGKGPYTTIHVTWNSNATSLWVNSVLLGSVQKQLNLSTNYALHLGRYPLWWVADRPLISAYIRNLQICSRPPLFSVHPILSSGQVFGDSYSNDTTTAQAQTWDVGKYFSMTAELYKMGLQLGGWSVQAFGGRRVIGSGNAALYLIDNVPTALLQNSTLVVFQAGANDLTSSGTLDKTAFTNGMHALIEKFMGVNGNPFTYTRKMVICSTPWAPLYTSTAFALSRQPDITSINTIQAGMPAWFDATYPSKAGSVKYFNMLSQFGGFNPAPDLFGADLLHPSPKGGYVMGKGWASGIISSLN